MDRQEKEMKKKGYVKKNGFWVSEKMERFEPAMPMFCPKCDRALQHKDDVFMRRKRMCSDCMMEVELKELIKDD